MNKIQISSAIASILLISSGEAYGQSVFQVDDYAGANDREKINAALSAMKDVSGAKTLSFARREYLVEPADFDTFAPVVGVDGVSQLAIEGNGAVLVAKDALNCHKGYFFKISNFSDVKMKDITLVYRPLPYVQGRIASVSQKDNKVVVDLESGFDGIDALRQTRDSKIWCRIGLKASPNLPKPGSPSWMEVKFEEGGCIGRLTDGSRQYELQAGFFSYEETVGGDYNWMEGDPIVIWKRGAQDGFCFEGGKNLSINNIKVESSLHFAIKVRGVSKVEIAGCQVAPVPGGMISSGADGVDVQQSEGISIEKCRLISTGDDAISLLNHGHGYNGANFERKFPGPHPETNENISIRGNQLAGGNRNGILLLGSKALVESNEVSDVRQYGLKFAGNDTEIRENVFRNCASFAAYRHINDELDTGVICSDEWVQSNAVVEKNTVEDWRHMPGLLLKSVKGAKVIQNNFIMHDPGKISEKPFNSYLDQNKAICVTTGFFKGETMKSGDILVAGNVVSASGAWKKFEDALHVNGEYENLKIENNSFKIENGTAGN